MICTCTLYEDTRCVDIDSKEDGAMACAAAAPSVPSTPRPAAPTTSDQVSETHGSGNSSSPSPVQAILVAAGAVIIIASLGCLAVRCRRHNGKRRQPTDVPTPCNFVGNPALIAGASIPGAPASSSFPPLDGAEYVQGHQLVSAPGTYIIPVQGMAAEYDQMGYAGVVVVSQLRHTDLHGYVDPNAGTTNFRPMGGESEENSRRAMDKKGLVRVITQASMGQIYAIPMTMAGGSGETSVSYA